MSQYIRPAYAKALSSLPSPPTMHSSLYPTPISPPPTAVTQIQQNLVLPGDHSVSWNLGWSRCSSADQAQAQAQAQVPH